jgi:hypothetical protein
MENIQRQREYCFEHSESCVCAWTKCCETPDPVPSGNPKKEV